eukprot:RCo032863
MASAKIPPCKWAQNKDRIFLTIDVSDAKDATVSFEEKKVVFRGSGKVASGAAEFDTTINLNKEITPADCKHKVTDREIQVNLKKKESGFWERMTEEPSKVTKHWLSCDWSRWVDEDDEKAGGAGFPGMDDFGGYGDMGNMDYSGMGGDGGDSDDEEPPADLGDLEKKPEEEEDEEGAAAAQPKAE